MTLPGRKGGSNTRAERAIDDLIQSPAQTKISLSEWDHTLIIHCFALVFLFVINDATTTL